MKMLEGVLLDAKHVKWNRPCQNGPISLLQPARAGPSQQPVDVRIGGCVLGYNSLGQQPSIAMHCRIEIFPQHITGSPNSDGKSLQWSSQRHANKRDEELRRAKIHVSPTKALPRRPEDAVGH